MNDTAGITVLNQKKIKQLAIIYVFYILFSLIVHFYLLKTSQYFATERMMGIFKNPNQMGFFLVSVYLIVIFYNSKQLINSTIKYSSFFLFIALPVVLTGSRSALILLLGIFIIERFYDRKYVYLFNFLILGLMSIGFYLLFSDNAWNNLISMISQRKISDLEDVGNERFRIFLNLFDRNIVEILLGRDSGVGTNAIIYLQKTTNKEIIWLDSLLSVIQYNNGLIGMMIFLMLIFSYITINFIVRRSKVGLLDLFILTSSFFFIISDFNPALPLILMLRNNYYHGTFGNSVENLK
jgi:hypothetical protein